MSYTIAGRAIKNEYIALGTIFSTIAIAVASSSGGEKKASAAPVAIEKDTSISAATTEEDSFIRAFVAEAEKSEKSGH